MWWYISSLVNEWEWCIILESDTGILGKKESECSYQESNLPLSYRRLVGAKAIKLD